MGRRPFLRILLGPTASGKERVALACAGALSAPILSVDSMKIYRGLDIGTAKPSPAMRARVVHYGLDLVEPTEAFSVARYVETADAVVERLGREGAAPVLSGGTALYYKGLLEGLFDAPASDEALRRSLRRRAETAGGAALHAELAAVDPDAAAKVHPHDLRRVIRALEVAALTGEPISRRQAQWSPESFGGAGGLRYRFGMVGLAWDRPTLRRRIGERVARMRAAGLVEEAREVYARREAYARTPLQAVAYKEFFPFFEGGATLEEAVALLERNTRRLAKSQSTWFRKFPVRWIRMEEGRAPEETAAAVLAAWERLEAEWPALPGPAPEEMPL